MSSHPQMLDKYSVEVSYGTSLPLSPPPSATRPEFMGTNPASFHLSDGGGLSFTGSDIGIGRSHSMSSSASFTTSTTPDEGTARRLSDHYQDLEVADSPMFMRHSPQACWTPNWMTEMPHPLEMSIMESPQGQSPTSQQWVDENGDVDNPNSSMHLRLSDENPVLAPSMNSSQTSFRLASPPMGRGVNRMTSCPTFRGQSVGYQLQQQPPSPALDEHDMTNFSGYMERSCSNSSSLPSTPDSPDFYFTTNSQLHTSAVGFPVTPIVNQDRFADMYGQISETQQNGVPGPSMASTPRSSRTSSRSLPSPAATAVALAATKTSAKSTKTRSSRRVVSGSNGKGAPTKNVSASTSSMNGNGRGGPGLGGGEGGEIAFVNFTPQDATRILNGVAPSGSSKTKARREKEAQEKRRKLSEAAAAAVRALGGDTSQLPADLLAL